MKNFCKADDEVIKKAKELYDAINIIGCCDTIDIEMLNDLIGELDSRGYDPKSANTLQFRRRKVK